MVAKVLKMCKAQWRGREVGFFRVSSLLLWTPEAGAQLFPTGEVQLFLVFFGGAAVAFKIYSKHCSRQRPSAARL